MMSEGSEPVSEGEKSKTSNKPARKAAKRVSKKLVKREDGEPAKSVQSEVSSPTVHQEASKEAKAGKEEGKKQAESKDQPVASSQGASEPTETDAASDAVTSESGKRKRRRRRNRSEGGEGEGGSPMPPIRVDPEALGKAAWKIYLAEISEEGVALVGDKDAKELARRCFRLAEVFLEERSRQCERTESS